MEQPRAQMEGSGLAHSGSPRLQNASPPPPTLSALRSQMATPPFGRTDMDVMTRQELEPAPSAQASRVNAGDSFYQRQRPELMYSGSGMKDSGYSYVKPSGVTSTGTYAQLQMQISGLQDELMNEKQRAMSLREDANNSRLVIDSLNKQVQIEREMKETEVNSLRSEINKYKERIATLSDKIKSLEDENAKLKDDVEKYIPHREKNIKPGTENIADLKIKVEELTSELNNEKMEKNKILGNVDDQQEEIDKLSKKIADLEDEKQKLIEQQNRTNSELNNAQNLLNDTKSQNAVEIARLMSQINQLHQQITSKDSEFGKLCSKYESAEFAFNNEKFNLQNDLTEKEDRLEEANNEIERLNERIQNMEKKREQDLKKQDDLANTISNLKLELRKSAKDNTQSSPKHSDEDITSENKYPEISLLSTKTLEQTKPSIFFVSCSTQTYVQMLDKFTVMDINTKSREIQTIEQTTQMSLSQSQSQAQAQAQNASLGSDSPVVDIANGNSPNGQFVDPNLSISLAMGAGTPNYSTTVASRNRNCDLSILVDYKGQILKCQRKIQNLESVIERQNNEIKEMGEEIASKEVQIAEALSEKNNMQNRIIYLESEMATMADDAQQQQQINQQMLEKARENNELLEKHAEELNAQYQERLVVAATDMNNLKREYAKLNNEYSQALEKITAQSFVDTEKNDTINNLNKIIDEKQKKNEEMKRENEELVTSSKKLEEKLKDLIVKHKNDLDEANDKLKKAEHELQDSKKRTEAALDEIKEKDNISLEYKHALEDLATEITQNKANSDNIMNQGSNRTDIRNPTNNSSRNLYAIIKAELMKINEYKASLELEQAKQKELSNTITILHEKSDENNKHLLASKETNSQLLEEISAQKATIAKFSKYIKSVDKYIDRLVKMEPNGLTSDKELDLIVERGRNLSLNERNRVPTANINVNIRNNSDNENENENYIDSDHSSVNNPEKDFSNDELSSQFGTDNEMSLGMNSGNTMMPRQMGLNSADNKSIGNLTSLQSDTDPTLELEMFADKVVELIKYFNRSLSDFIRDVRIWANERVSMEAKRTNALKLEIIELNNKLDNDEQRRRFEDDLENKESEFTKKLNDMQLQYEEKLHAERLKHKEDMDNAVNDEVAALEKSIDDLKLENEHLNLVSANLLAQNEQLLNKIDKLKQKGQQRKKDMEDLQNKINESDNDCKTLNNNLQVTSQERDELFTEVEVLRGKLNDIIGENQSISNRQRDEAIEMSKMFDGYKTQMNTTVDQLIEKNQELENQIIEVKDANEALHTEKSMAIQECESTKAKLNEVENKLDLMTKERDAKNSEIEKLEKEKEEIRLADEEKLNATIEKIEEEKKVKINELNENIIATEKSKSEEIQKRENMLNDIKTELSKSQKELENEEEKNKVLEETIQNNEEHISRLQNTIEDIVRKYSEMSKLNDELTITKNSNDVLSKLLKEQTNNQELTNTVAKTSEKYLRIIEELQTSVEIIKSNTEFVIKRLKNQESSMMRNNDSNDTQVVNGQQSSNAYNLNYNELQQQQQQITGTMLLGWKTAMDDFDVIVADIKKFKEDLEKNISDTNTLITTQTMNEYLEEKIKLYTQRLIDIRGDNIAIIQGLLHLVASKMDGNLAAQYKVETEDLEQQYKGIIASLKEENNRLNEYNPVNVVNENALLKVQLQNTKSKYMAQVNEILRQQVKTNGRVNAQNNQINPDASTNSIKKDDMSGRINRVSNRNSLLSIENQKQAPGAYNGEATPDRSSISRGRALLAGYSASLRAPSMNDDASAGRYIPMKTTSLTTQDFMFNQQMSLLKQNMQSQMFTRNMANPNTNSMGLNDSSLRNSAGLYGTPSNVNGLARNYGPGISNMNIADPGRTGYYSNSLNSSNYLGSNSSGSGRMSVSLLGAGNAEINVNANISNDIQRPQGNYSGAVGINAYGRMNYGTGAPY